MRMPARRPAGDGSGLGWPWLVGVGAVTGVVGGLTSVGYLAVLAALSRLAGPDHYTWLPRAGLLIGAGGLISLLLGVLGDPGDSGVLIDSVHTEGGPPRTRALAALVPVSLLTIAVGGGIGPEPVLMQTTGTLATAVGRRFGANRVDLRVLTVTGMASGLTVLFAAPLGGAVFALEILHRRGLEYYEALVPACVGSLVSYGVYVLATGRGLGPEWPVPGGPPRLVPVDLLLGLCAGVAGAAVAHGFGLLIRGCRWLFGRVPSWCRPPVAGLALAVLGGVLPSSLTFGEAQLGRLVIASAVAGAMLVAVAVGHLLSAAITLAGRWKGGIIIPMFLVGYCLGRVTALWTGPHGHSIVLAASMMVACNVGMTKTPLGSTLVVAQMTGLGNLPPLLIAALTSLVLSQRVTFVRGQRHREPDAARERANVTVLRRDEPDRGDIPQRRAA